MIRQGQFLGQDYSGGIGGMQSVDQRLIIMEEKRDTEEENDKMQDTTSSAVTPSCLPGGGYLEDVGRGGGEGDQSKTTYQTEVDHGGRKTPAPPTELTAMGNDNIDSYRSNSRVEFPDTDSHMPDLNNSGTKKGMKTRGNRRPILLTERMRQKRQTLQDMAKPLKTWLYEHRDNPYPTKTEKTLLAVGSQMTLVQVSNWFANARRRLKNTVRHPGISWSNRIKMYNSHVTGNAERLSISSNASSISDFTYEDDHSPEDPNPQLSCYETISNSSSRPPSRISQDHHDLNSHYQPTESIEEVAQPHKFKHSILHRYLNDSFEHAQRFHRQKVESRRRNGSGAGSVSSHEYEDVSISRLSPDSLQSNEAGHQESAFFDDSSRDLSERLKNTMDYTISSYDEEDTYWKEINAALALTNMARSCRQHQPIIT